MPVQKKIYFCGDAKVKNISDIISSAKSRYIPNLPLNDRALPHRLLRRKLKGGETFFFSPGYPTSGYQKIAELRTLSTKAVEERYISFQHRKEARIICPREGKLDLPANDIEFLFNNWSIMIDYYVSQYPGMVILPLSAHYFDIELSLSRQAMEIVSTFSRVVDVSPLNEISKINYADTFGNLTTEGWGKVKDNVLKWVD